MKIEIPQLPPVEFSPNWRGFWRKRYEAGWQFKADVHYCALDAKSKEPEFKTLEYAELKMTFVVKEARIRDADNWIARMKPGVDALVDAGVIQADDQNHLRITSVDFKIDKNIAPMTIVEVSKQAGIEC